MIRNIKKTFQLKTGLREKQILQHPGYAACRYMLHSACNEIRNHPNSFHCICQHCRYIQWNYNVDSNMQSSNYSKVQFKALIYFELQQTLN